MSSRIIDARIEGVDLKIWFTYVPCGDFVVESNYVATDPAQKDLWELESPDVRRQVESAASTDLARNGRL